MSDPRPSILIADDEEAILFALSTYLQASGYRVTCVNTMQGALAWLASETFDLVVADLCFTGPGCRGGLEVCAAAQRRASPPRAIMVTGSGPAGVREEAQALGVDAFLLKPLDLAALRLVIGELVTRGRALAMT